MSVKPEDTQITKTSADAELSFGRHVTVFKKRGQYGGWPANGGLWIWENEIVVVFASGRYKAPVYGATGSFERPLKLRQARSTDGGESWELEEPLLLLPPDQAPSTVSAPFHFDHPDFAMLFKHASKDVGPSWFYTSFDRCRNWQSAKHFEVPGITQIAARTDYIVQNDRHCIAFASHAKQDGLEGRIFCAETRDGGMTWGTYLIWVRSLEDIRSCLRPWP